MKNDTQHLDFLISQYVDATLDATSRKAIEQKISSDPIAATLYKEHRDIQDLLDDCGNRLPMIDWDAFNRTLADRLEKEQPVVAKPVTTFQRWIRALAAAAALFIAGTVGYTWHAMTVPVAVPVVIGPQPHEIAQPQHLAEIIRPAATGPSMDTVIYEQPKTALGGGNVEIPQATAGTNKTPSETADSLQNSHNLGMQNLPSKTGAVVGSAVTKPSPNDFLQQ